MAFLIIGPLLAMVLPTEISRWYLAAAREKSRIGDGNRALELVDKALKWNSQSADGYALRSFILLEKNDLGGALEDGSRAVDLAPKNPNGYRARIQVYLRQENFSEALQDAGRVVELAPKNPLAYQARSQIYLHQKNFSKAVADSRKVVELLRSSKASELSQELNNQAYFVALGIAAGDIDRKQIPAALRDIDEALTTGPTNDSYLDTRGYLFFLQGNLEDALRDFDHAIDLAKIRFKRVQTQIPESENRQTLFAALYNETLAVMYHHRYLVHKDMGNEKQAADDYDLAIEFGFDPDDELR